MSEIIIPHVDSPYPFEAYVHVVEPLTIDDGGGYLITFPDLPGCMSDGETEAEAVANAREAFSVWMSARAHMGKPIPKPTRHRAGAPDAAPAGQLARQLGGAGQGRRYVGEYAGDDVACGRNRSA